MAQVDVEDYKERTLKLLELYRHTYDIAAECELLAGLGKAWRGMDSNERIEVCSWARSNVARVE